VTEKKASLSRRNFLLTLGAGGAASAAAIVAGRPAAQRSPAREKRSTQGYRVTEHVNNYYRTAKV
jgi:hypothetical protein